MNKSIVFSKNTFNRILKSRGVKYVFFRQKKNDFGEPLPEISKEIPVVGIYHALQHRLPRESAEAAGTTHLKSAPMITCAPIDAKLLMIGDYAIINDIKHTIVGINNLNSADIAYEITLENELDGTV